MREKRTHPLYNKYFWHGSLSGRKAGGKWKLKIYEVGKFAVNKRGICGLAVRRMRRRGRGGGGARAREREMEKKVGWTACWRNEVNRDIRDAEKVQSIVRDTERGRMCVHRGNVMVHRHSKLSSLGRRENGVKLAINFFPALGPTTLFCHEKERERDVNESGRR